MKKTTRRIPRVERAIREWENLLGAERVLTDPKILAQTGTATFAFPQEVPAVIQPGSTAEVQGCLRIANEFRAPVYPVSRGMNWGLGSKVPPSTGCVVMDLSRMNRIVTFDERSAMMTVEPGVTFQQGHDYLMDQGSQLMLTCTGGPKDGSILGNALERGDGTGPYGNRAETTCHMQVVLPNGDVIRTGPGRFAGARAAGLTRDVPGPGLDGLFFQSNLGVVTEMTVWLMPRPAYHRVLSFRLGGIESLPRFLNALQEIALRGVIPACCAGVWNSYKLFMANWRYPWGMTGGATPFVMREHAGSEPWFSTVLICAPARPVGELLESEVRQKLGPLAQEITATSSIFDPDSTSLGRPGNQNVRSMYWRKRESFAGRLDPEQDRCGVIWLCPALPLDGEPVASLLGHFEKIVRQHGFEPSIGFNVVSPRCLHAFVMLSYDRDVPSEDERAMECHDRLFASMVEEGYYPYRLGIHSMALYRRLAGARSPWIEALKRQLDPNQILAPGRYE